jgi:5-hydroxyisourate hydrolase
MARLSTHVLDTALGRPASGLRLDLHFLDGTMRQHLKSTETNADGRTDEPLLSGQSLPLGIYEITFHAGAYLRACGANLKEPLFLDEIVIRFGVSDPDGNYHVPLLLSPFGYSTYRGS